MNTKISKFIFYFPRILSIAFVLFLAIFALDVFGEGYSFLETVGAFLIHLIPNFVIALFIWLSWKRGWIGGIFFVVIGILYIALSWSWGDWISWLILSGPAFLIGGMYFLGDYLNKK
jgi:hypothetical protein